MLVWNITNKNYRKPKFEEEKKEKPFGKKPSDTLTQGLCFTCHKCMNEEKENKVGGGRSS